MHERFERLAREDPRAPALWTPAGTVDRAELLAASRDCERVLNAAVEGRAVVAIAAADGLPFLAALHACWRSERIAMLLDVAEPPRRQAETGARFGARAILRVGARPVCEPLASGTELDLGDAAAIKLTSGSTGSPSGIVVSEPQLAADVRALDSTMGLLDSDRVVAAVPMSFSYGLSSVALPVLLNGRVAIIPDRSHPLGILRAARAGRATVLPTVPSFLSAVVDRRPALPDELRLVISAGARLPATTARRFRELFGQPVHVFYGASECGGICYDRTGEAAERGTVGTPVEGVLIHVDREHRVIVESLAVAARTVPPAGSITPGRFTTSDLGEWHDDELALLGRTGELMHLGAHKVHPLEIERVIAAMPDVVEAIVTAEPGRREGPTRAIAVVVPNDGSLDEPRVREHCLANLPAHKVPRRIVLTGTIPRTTRGKLDTTKLIELLAGDAREMTCE